MRLSLEGMKSSLTGVKPSGFTKISLAAGGVLFVAWLGLTLFTGEGAKKSGPAKVDASKCPDCGRPLTREAVATGECPFCKMDDPGLSKKKARVKGNESAIQGKVIPTVLGSAFALLVGGNVVVFVRSKWGRPKEDDLFYLNCRKCDRRVRYRSRQAGALARCPNCRCLIRFPEAPERKGRWSAVKNWLTPTRKTKVQKGSA